MKDLLVISNGHGEDAVACSTIAALQSSAQHPLSIACWPMVGNGAAYRRLGLTTVGPANLLPSEGFATLDWGLMLRDLAAGWITTHWRQACAARAKHGRYRLMLCVGDVVPIAAACLARTPFLFIGCAKSAYYGPIGAYSLLEISLLRRYCLNAFPRDEATATQLEIKGVPTRYLGNPMMDGLEGGGDFLDPSDEAIVIAMLPGTRSDALENIVALLAASAACARRLPQPDLLSFVFPVAPDTNLDELPERLLAADGGRAWTCEMRQSNSNRGVIFRFAGPDGASAVVARDCFADTLRRSVVAVGMAGTANEQAIGLGVPLVAVPARGSQGEKYARMKERYFGCAAVSAPLEPQAIARQVERLLADSDRRRSMAAAGRLRMGKPGASAAIAREILAVLNNSPGRVMQ